MDHDPSLELKMVDRKTMLSNRNPGKATFALAEPERIPVPDPTKMEYKSQKSINKS